MSTCEWMINGEVGRAVSLPAKHTEDICSKAYRRLQPRDTEKMAGRKRNRDAKMMSEEMANNWGNPKRMNKKKKD